MFWTIAAVLVVLLLAAMLPLLLTVDNWSRDLTTNHAATSDSAANENLQPLSCPLSPDELATLVESVAAELPQWEKVESSRQDGAIRVTFVRSTKLLRFQDDITVVVTEQADGGSRLTAESRSRIGKGDLGQNPRNLIELLGGVRSRLDERKSATGD